MDIALHQNRNELVLFFTKKCIKNLEINTWTLRHNCIDSWKIARTAARYLQCVLLLCFYTRTLGSWQLVMVYSNTYKYIHVYSTLSEIPVFYSRSSLWFICYPHAAWFVEQRGKVQKILNTNKSTKSFFVNYNTLLHVSTCSYMLLTVHCAV
jgi:hypothetical protein